MRSKLSGQIFGDNGILKAKSEFQFQKLLNEFQNQISDYGKFSQYFRVSYPAWSK